MHHFGDSVQHEKIPRNREPHLSSVLCTAWHFFGVGGFADHGLQSFAVFIVQFFSFDSCRFDTFLQSGYIFQWNLIQKKTTKPQMQLSWKYSENRLELGSYPRNSIRIFAFDFKISLVDDFTAVFHQFLHISWLLAIWTQQFIF